MHAAQHFPVIPVTLAILASIFIAALLALVLLCKNKICQWLSLFENQENRKQQMLGTIGGDIHLVSSQETEEADFMAGIDPEDLYILPDLDKLLESHRWKWVDDALGLVPHCLMMLKGCHLMSERLVATAMASTEQQKFIHLAMVAKSILPLVDDLLRCMCPPINPRSVENRALTVLKAVTRLGKLTQRTCNASWPAGIIDDMNKHYQHLKEISLRFPNSEPPSGLDRDQESVIIVESSLSST